MKVGRERTSHLGASVLGALQPARVLVIGMAVGQPGACACSVRGRALPRRGREGLLQGSLAVRGVSSCPTRSPPGGKRRAAQRLSVAPRAAPGTRRGSEPGPHALEDSVTGVPGQQVANLTLPEAAGAPPGAECGTGTAHGPHAPQPSSGLSGGRGEMVQGRPEASRPVLVPGRPPGRVLDPLEHGKAEGRQQTGVTSLRSVTDAERAVLPGAAAHSPARPCSPLASFYCRARVQMPSLGARLRGSNTSRCHTTGVAAHLELPSSRTETVSSKRGPRGAPGPCHSLRPAASPAPSTAPDPGVPGTRWLIVVFQPGAGRICRGDGPGCVATSPASATGCQQQPIPSLGDKQEHVQALKRPRRADRGTVGH